MLRASADREASLPAIRGVVCRMPCMAGEHSKSGNQRKRFSENCKRGSLGRALFSFVCNGRQLVRNRRQFEADQRSLQVNHQPKEPHLEISFWGEGLLGPPHPTMNSWLPQWGYWGVMGYLGFLGTASAWVTGGLDFPGYQGSRSYQGHWCWSHQGGSGGSK